MKRFSTPVIFALTTVIYTAITISEVIKYNTSTPELGRVTLIGVLALVMSYGYIAVTEALVCSARRLFRKDASQYFLEKRSFIIAIIVLIIRFGRYIYRPFGMALRIAPILDIVLAVIWIIRLIKFIISHFDSENVSQSSEEK